MTSQLYLNSAYRFLFKEDQRAFQNVRICTCSLYIVCIEFVPVSMHFDYSGSVYLIERVSFFKKSFSLWRCLKDL